MIFFFLMLLRPPRSTLFPYTMLFRSGDGQRAEDQGDHARIRGARLREDSGSFAVRLYEPELAEACDRFTRRVWPKSRSEEHTSELQSHSDIVCRLLLERKTLRNHSRA